MCCAGVAACLVRPPAIESPSQSDAPWIEVRSPHFTLVSDLDAADADDVIRTAEESYALLARVLFGRREAPTFQTNLIAFRSEGEFRGFVPAPYTGRYVSALPNDLEPSPTMLMFGKLSPENRITLSHELAHRFNHVALPSMPVWLNEGMAQYLSTVRGSVERPVVGELNPEYGYAPGSVNSDPNHVVFQGGIIDHAVLPRPSALMRLDRAGFYLEGQDTDKTRGWEARQKLDANYAAAWALVHMLMRESAIGQPLRRVVEEPDARGELAEVLRSFAIGATDVDREFEAYLKKAQLWRDHHPPEPAPLPTVQRRPFAEPEVLIWWARLGTFKAGSNERAEGHLKRAASAAPEDPDVLFWRARYETINGNVAGGASLLTRALAQRPNAAGYQLALALLYLVDQPNRPWPADQAKALARQAFERLEEIAATATQLNAVAVYRLLTSGADGARTPAAEACQLAPDCWACLHTYAAASFRARDWTSAVALEKTALERLPESAPAKTAVTIARALERYKRVAGGGPPSGDGDTTLFLP
jgi:hypothetical protein